MIQEKPTLFEEIAESIRHEILIGDLNPGDSLPTVRQASRKWRCAPGTVQRAYNALQGEGLITCRPGQGSRVAARQSGDLDPRLQRAQISNQAEAFLLTMVQAGYSTDEISEGLATAIERWKQTEEKQTSVDGSTVRFNGSHDPLVAMLDHLLRSGKGDYKMQIKFTGSLGGLIALAQQQADIAGCHLWDQETDSYNAPFVRRILPGQPVALVNLMKRKLGIILPAGGTGKDTSLQELLDSGQRMINRQPGAGTRIWLDAQLAGLNIDTIAIPGFSDEMITHEEVARAIADGKADWGIGIQTAAIKYGLDFLSQTLECYDLVVPMRNWDQLKIVQLVQIVSSGDFAAAFSETSGYEWNESGKILMVE